MTDAERSQHLAAELARRLGMTIADEHLPAVAANFDLIARMAAFVESAPEEPDELATVYSA